MNRTSLTEKLSRILFDIVVELSEKTETTDIKEKKENFKIFSNLEQRVNRIKKAFCFVEKEINRYVSKFSLDENCKN